MGIVINFYVVRQRLI